MDVYDFCMLSCDDSARIEICDLSDDATIVFMGEAQEAMESKYGGYEVLSYDLYLGTDNTPTICLNIETGENDE